MGSNKYRKVISAKPTSFQRTRGMKPPAKGILIATEGEVTEPVYFAEVKRLLNLPTVEVEVAGCGIGDPRALAEKALELQKRRRKAAKDDQISYMQVGDFDEIWIVFDTDIPLQHGKLHDGLQFATSKKILSAHSTPCFEYWLLLHLDRTTAPMAKCENVIPRLREKLGKPYSKNGEETKALMPTFAKILKIAEDNAVWVRKQHTTGGTEFPCNPSTEVDRLIAAIRKAGCPANQDA